MTRNPRGFVAYPSSPKSVRDVISESVRVINHQHALEIQTWEELAIGGRPIIDGICQAIDAANIFIADLTNFNPNVLYELGYAIGRGKKIWLLFDDTYAGQKWSDFRLLSSIGYKRSTNSEQVISAFATERPHEHQAPTLFQRYIEPALAPAVSGQLLYLKSFHQTNASTQITRRVDKSPLPRKADDPREVISQPLNWYAAQIGSSTAVLCHFDNPARANTLIRNATVALVAGLAHGLDKQTLLLTEGDYLSPLDYRDRLRHYTNAADAHSDTDEWLSKLEDEWQAQESARERAKVDRQRYGELRQLSLGEYVAENEEIDLLSKYFVETTAYDQALRGGQTNLLFVGRKGAGKTANYLKLVDTFSSDTRNIICELKPPSYEMSALIEALKRFVDKDKKQFIVEGLWRFLLYTEMVDGIVQRLVDKPHQAWTSDEQAIAQLRRSESAVFDGDLALRLEALTDRLNAVDSFGTTSLRDFRNTLAKTLYTDLIGDLRNAILRALPRGARIRVLVDNLDKAWEKSADLSVLAEFLLGLLSATSKIANEIADAMNQRRGTLSLTVFLRADIFDRIRTVAREPDKLRYQKLDWNDREMLLRLVDERYARIQSDEVTDALWSRFFTHAPGGVPPKTYVFDLALPKPRDVLYLLNTAIATAGNRRHARVEASDLEEAAKKYSEFAFDALTIEDLSYEQPIADALIELAGKPSVMDADSIIELLRRGGAEHADESVLDRLCLLSFLTIEVRPGDFQMVEDDKDLQRKLVLARNLAAGRGGKLRYRVHPAFSTYLQMT